MVQRERQISITVLIMLMMFLAAWFPFVVADFVLVCCMHCRSQGFLITLSLGFPSSGINPVLNAWRFRRFKQGLLKKTKLRVRENFRISPRLSRVRPFVGKPSHAAMVELEPLPIHKLENDTCSVVVGTGSTKQKHS